MEKTARDSKKTHLMSLGGLPQGLCHQISNLELCAPKKYLPRSESFPVEFRVDKLPSRMDKSGWKILRKLGTPGERIDSE